MQVLAVVVALFAAAQAGLIAPAGVIPTTTLVRTPSLDSAVIKSDRLGGNFAYSTVEGHAYAAVSPVVQNVVSPVGVSYSATPYAHPVQATYSAVHAAPIAAYASPYASPYGYAASPYIASPYGVRLGY